MTAIHPAVDWVLDQLEPVVFDVENTYTHRNGGNCTLRRVDRDNSQVYDGSEEIDMTEPVHTRVSEFKAANYVGVSFVDRSGTPAGTEYMLDTDVVVNVRISGMTSREYGHVDPNGEQGIPFGELVGRVRDAINEGRHYPDAGGSSASFTHLVIGNEDPQSNGWKDFYRHSFDVTFNGFESLSDP